MDRPDEYRIAELERLEALHDAGGDSIEVLPPAALEELVGGREKAYPWLREAQGQGLVTFDGGLVPRVRLSATGLDRVRRARGRRASRAERRVASKAHLLAWTDDRSKREADLVNALEFSKSPYGWFEGDRFEWGEVVAAAKYLTDDGLIVSHPIKSSMGIARVDVAITAKGQECVDECNGDPASCRARARAAVGSGVDERSVVEVIAEIQEQFNRHPIGVPVEGDARGGATNVYNAPVIYGDAHGAQLAWGNETVSQAVNQAQDGAQQVAAGLEALAVAVTEILRGLPNAGLSDEDLQAAEESGREILVEVTQDEPDRTRLKRTVTFLKGVLAPLATGATNGAGEGTHDWARTAIAQIPTPF